MTGGGGKGGKKGIRESDIGNGKEEITCNGNIREGERKKIREKEGEITESEMSNIEEIRQEEKKRIKKRIKKKDVKKDKIQVESEKEMEVEIERIRVDGNKTGKE